MLTLKHYVDDFEISLKRFLMVGLPYTVSLSSIGALLKKSVTNVTRNAETRNVTLGTEKKEEKPTIFEGLQGVLNDTGEVQKKNFFWTLLGTAPVRTAKIFAIAQEFNG